MARTVEIARRLVAGAVSQPETLGDGDCEKLHDGLLGQPVNTLSSLGYVAIGIWLLERTRRLPPRRRRAARSFAAMVALTGVGSVAYHGPQFDGAQLFHDLPVVGVLGIGLGVPITRRIRGEAVLPADASARVWAAAGLGALAGLAYLGGRTDSPGCDPDSLLQLHALWHLCTGAAVAIWATALWPVESDG